MFSISHSPHFGFNITEIKIKKCQESFTAYNCFAVYPPTIMVLSPTEIDP